MPDPVRYTYPLAARDEEQLQSEIAALALPGFLGVCGSGVEVQLVFAAALAQADADAAFAAVMGHVPDPNAALNRTRAEALPTLLTRADVTGVQVRLVIAALTFLFNNRLESLGQPRVLESEILGYIVANPMLGDPVTG